VFFVERGGKWRHKPLPVEVFISKFHKLDGAGIYFLRRAYWLDKPRRRHASNRTNSGGQKLLLSQLRGTLFCDAFAGFQD
jgi:hypothetical protein